MPWFTRICRHAGLLIHDVIKPIDRKQKCRVNKQVEEKKVSPTVTLRRTTIDEIEVRKPDDQPDASSGAA